MLVTQYGRRATVVVCALRIGAAAFTGAALITGLLSPRTGP